MRDIERLHPELKVKCYKLIKACMNAGIDIVITQTLRSEADQNGLYMKGRRGIKGEQIVTNLKYPSSPHCWGVAFDVAIRDGNGISYPIDKLTQVGIIGESIGLTWGGRFKSFVDRPHFELQWFSLSRFKQLYGTPEKFIATWTKEDGEVEKVRVFLNGKEVESGFLKDGKTFVPVRVIAESQGLKVAWDGKNKIVNITK